MFLIDDKRIERVAAYTEDYKTECKHAWFSAGRPPRAKDFLECVPFDAHGRKPTINLLREWRRDLMWDFWADEMDSKAVAIVEDELIVKKTEMLRRHAEMAENLQNLGMEYLKNGKFDSSASAVQAIIRGAELERTSRGFGEMLLKMSKMGDSELKDEFLKLVNRASENGQLDNAVDVEPLPEEKEDTTEE